MKKTFTVLGAILAAVLMAACSTDYVKKAGDLCEEAAAVYEDWENKDWAEFSKKVAQLEIDFYESNPTVEERDAFNEVWDEFGRGALKDLDIPGGDWTFMLYLDEDNKELNSLHEKLYKVREQWEKAHKDELGEDNSDVPMVTMEEIVDDDDDDFMELVEVEEVVVDTDETVASEVEDDGDNTVYDVVDQMPEFPGGDGQLVSWIDRNLQRTDDDAAGRVVCQVVVEKDGSITGAKLIRGLNARQDAEVLRLVQSMPKWIPGSMNGQAKRVHYTLPVSFR